MRRIRDWANGKLPEGTMADPNMILIEEYLDYLHGEIREMKDYIEKLQWEDLSS